MKDDDEMTLQACLILSGGIGTCLNVEVKDDNQKISRLSENTVKIMACTHWRDERHVMIIRRARVHWVHDDGSIEPDGIGQPLVSYG
jgi:hypothetical protein